MEALGQWKERELRLARGFRECSGLSRQDLEDIYQDTVIVLLERSYESEEHLRNALHRGLKMRALGGHAKEARRQEITKDLQSHEGSDENVSAEHTALTREDRLIVTEFLAGLSTIEQRVFWLIAEGMKYRQISRILGIESKEAHKAERSCERRREHFQLLYDTGRLCRYRESTIKALQSGQATSEALAHSALAHLERCPTCRAEHRTDARRLRLRFQGQAAVLLPMPTLLRRAGRLTSLFSARTRALQHRLATDVAPLKSPDMRERTILLLAGGSATAKIAAGVAGVAMIAGTISATHAFNQHAPRRPHQISRRMNSTQSSYFTAEPTLRTHVNGLHNSPAPERASKRRFPGHVVPLGRGAPGHVVTVRRSRPPQTHEYEAGESSRILVRTSQISLGRSPTTQPQSLHQRGGGPFSP